MGSFVPIDGRSLSDACGSGSVEYPFSIGHLVQHGVAPSAAAKFQKSGRLINRTE